jgi:hypothetical protein
MPLNPIVEGNPGANYGYGRDDQDDIEHQHRQLG